MIPARGRPGSSSATARDAQPPARPGAPPPCGRDRATAGASGGCRLRPRSALAERLAGRGRLVRRRDGWRHVAIDRPGTVTLSAVGDTMLGYAGTLAPDPDTYFDGVRPQITGDIRFANMEGTLTNQTSGKCGANSTACYEFRVPPSWARYFKHAGFTIVSNANNHAFDFWQAGLDDTVTALDREGLAHTGRTHEITYLHVHGLIVAFIGVASYPNTGPLNDYRAARRLIQAADRHADMVVVAMHAGAEGVGAEHLIGQDEIYEGENRGNPEAFAPMAIDAGADLIIGYSPHVLRAMQVYHHRLIAYSLG